MKEPDFYDLDIVVSFLNARRDEIHEFAQEFDDYSRKETEQMVERVTWSLIPKMYEKAAV